MTWCFVGLTQIATRDAAPHLLVVAAEHLRASHLRAGATFSRDHRSRSQQTCSSQEAQRLLQTVAERSPDGDLAAPAATLQHEPPSEGAPAAFAHQADVA